jgi:hypothetical protein
MMISPASVGPGRFVRLLGSLVVLALAATGCQRAPTPDANQRMDDALVNVTPSLMKAHVKFLSDDVLRGRDTGDVGFEIAREYVVAQFQRIGLEPPDGTSYLQPFDLVEVGADLGSQLKTGTVSLKEPETRFTPVWVGGGSQWEGDSVFVGYGLTTNGRDDYAGVDVKGKAVWLLAGSPPGWAEERDKARAAAAKVEVPLRKGAAIVIELTLPAATKTEAVATASQKPNPPPPVSLWRHEYALADGTTGHTRPQAVVGPAGTAKILSAWGLDPQTVRQTADAGSGRPHEVGQVRLVRRHETRLVRCWNIIGIVRGSDAGRRDESVVFVSHLDHMGIGAPDASGDTIYNGAHDNAIGVARLLGAAEAMARLKPRRSIVFAVVAAEERGMLGSWYYVRHAVLPIEKTVAAINQDGGREGIAPDDVIANCADLSDLGPIIGEVMKQHGVGLLATDRAARDHVGFSSDHYSFLLAGVPAIDFKDGYTIKGDVERAVQERLTYFKTLRHRQADNFDAKLFTLESAAEMTKRSVWLAWYLANMEGMPSLKTDNVFWRPRRAPERSDYFGPNVKF